MEIVIPSEATILEIVEEIWSSVIVDAGDLLHKRLESESTTPAVLAYIEITGHWHGSVRLACSPRAARHIAAGMFAMAESEVSDDELADAVGEFTNIVGGNIKALFPSPCGLSLPGVAGIGAFGDTLPPGMPASGGNLKVAELHLAWDSEPIVVTLWEGSRQ